MKKLMLFMLAAMLGIVAANAQGTGTIVVADRTATNSNVPFYGTFAAVRLFILKVSCQTSQVQRYRVLPGI